MINKKALISESKIKSTTNSLSDWNLKVKIVFQMIDEENRIPQLYCMMQEATELGKPHIVAYIDNKIEQLKERFAV